MASGPITSWEIDGETVETVSDFILGGSKITVDGDCSHEIKRRLLLGINISIPFLWETYHILKIFFQEVTPISHNSHPVLTIYLRKMCLRPFCQIYLSVYACIW